MATTLQKIVQANVDTAKMADLSVESEKATKSTLGPSKSWENFGEKPIEKPHATWISPSDVRLQSLYLDTGLQRGSITSLITRMSYRTTIHASKRCFIPGIGMRWDPKWKRRSKDSKKKLTALELWWLLEGQSWLCSVLLCLCTEEVEN